MGDTVIDLWNNKVVGTELIISTEIAPGLKEIHTTYTGGNIFVTTITVDALTQQTTHGWKLTPPALPLGTIKTSASLVWTGSALGVRGTIRDTLTGLVLEGTELFDSEGISYALGGGVRTDQWKEMLTYTQRMIKWKTMGEVAAVVGLAALLVFLAADDITGIGVSDDAAIPGVIAALAAIFSQLVPQIEACPILD